MPFLCVCAVLNRCAADGLVLLDWIAEPLHTLTLVCCELCLSLDRGGVTECQHGPVINATT